LARWRFLGWKVCFVIVPARNPLHPASGLVRHRPQKARKRADRPMHGRGAFIVRRMIGLRRRDRQTFAAGSRPRGCRRRSVGHLFESVVDTPGEYRGFALRAPGGGAMFRPPKPRRPDLLARPEPRSPPRSTPRQSKPTVPRDQRVHIDLWTRSRSGAPPSASSR
jgi:hypothetical protein